MQEPPVVHRPLHLVIDGAVDAFEVEDHKVLLSSLPAVLLQVPYHRCLASVGPAQQVLIVHALLLALDLGFLLAETERAPCNASL